MTSTNATAEVPGYLKDYADDYRQDPRGAALKWFKDARMGLFMHYGVYAPLARGEWVQFHQNIPVMEYDKLADTFDPKNFDADFIADLALEAEMRYVVITSRHHDSYCLFKTAQTDFNSVDRGPKRDLVGELAEACARKGLGFGLYYSHGRDWRHPHCPDRGRTARPAYDPPDPTYATGDDYDFSKYIDFMFEQTTELLTQYGPICTMWLDGWGGVVLYEGEDRKQWRLQEYYDHIHSLQPHCLISAKNGLTGTEDYYAPEERWITEHSRPFTRFVDPGDKPIEVCAPLWRSWWGYNELPEACPKWTPQVWNWIGEMRAKGYNCLINTGPKPDGSIIEGDAKVLREIGERIRREGWPGEK